MLGAILIGLRMRGGKGGTIIEGLIGWAEMPTLSFSSEIVLKPNQQTDKELSETGVRFPQGKGTTASKMKCIVLPIGLLREPSLL